MTNSEANEKRFDALAAQWDSKPARVETAMAFVDKVFELVNNSDKDYDISNFDVLDYGSGSGLVSFGIAKSVKSVIGLDNSTAMVDVYNDKANTIGLTNIEAKKHDINDQELDKELFDMAVTNMTMHHIGDIKMFINKLSSSLKDDGMLFIADLVTEDGTFHSDNTGVEHFGFDMDDIYKSFEESGLKDIDVQKLHSINKDPKSYDIFIAYGRK